jgi:hypothetical protein
MAGHEDTLALEWTAKCALASSTTKAEMWPTLETTGQSGGRADIRERKRMRSCCVRRRVSSPGRQSVAVSLAKPPDLVWPAVSLSVA